MIRADLKPLKKWLRSGGENVTYIAALRSPEGIVILADTQESYTEEIVYVEKIEIHKELSYQIAIAGAGRGELVDGFILHVSQLIKKNAPANDEQLERLLAHALIDFYRNDVRLLPGKHKGIRFIIAATQANGTGVCLWQTKGTRLFKVPKKAVIGYRAPFCEYVLKRLYTPDLPLSQLVLLSTYLVAIAKESGISVGGDTQLVVVKNNGISPEDAQYIKDMENRLRAFEQQTDKIFLACADISISVLQLHVLLNGFAATVEQLHRSQIDRYIAPLTVERLADTSGPYAKVPSDTTILLDSPSGPARVVHDKTAQQTDDGARRANQLFLAQGFTAYIAQRISSNQVSLKTSHRWEEPPREDEDLGTKTQLEFGAFINDQELAPPMNLTTLHTILAAGDNQVIFYAKPKPQSAFQPSTSQT